METSRGRVEGAGAPGRSRSRLPARWGPRAAGVVAALLAAAGCASYVAQSRDMRPLLASRDYAGALAAIEPANTTGSRLLYLYERGLILRDAGDYAGSNAALDQADQLYDDLYTRSLSRALASVTITDNLLEYRGERFEATQVHYFKAMNYLALGKLGEAAVECRRLNHELQVFRDRGGSFYQDDPFLQYLTGMVYVANRERVDGDVSLRQALESFRALAGTCGATQPPSLLCDLAENSAALGNRAESAGYGREGACPASGPAGTGRLNLFLECGYVPRKVERELVVPIYGGEIHDDLDQDAYGRELARRWNQPRESGRELEYLLKIAVPVQERPPCPYASARVHAVEPGQGATSRASAVVVEDLGTLSVRSLDEKQPQILARAVARGLSKYLATREAKKKKGKAAGWLVNLAGVATEVADTRHWSALPERILMSRLDLPAGTYDLEVELLGPAGERVQFVHVPDVTIAAGGTHFLSRRVF